MSEVNYYKLKKNILVIYNKLNTLFIFLFIEKIEQFGDIIIK